MATTAASSGKPKSATQHFLVALLVLAGVLGALFHLSFEANNVLFANDGPLGALVAYADVAKTFFTGSWHSLNWLGIKQPSALPNLTYGTYLLWGPLAHAKFFTPLALLLLGLGVWVFFHQLKFKPAICLLGALAAVLNTDPFSYACWGLPSLPLTVAATFFALAALASDPARSPWLKAALAGLALGMGIMEGYDTGAIFSLYIAAFVLFQALTNEGPVPKKLGRGFVRVAVVAGFAAFIAAHALSTLIGTQIKGVAEMRQDTKTKEQRWDEATLWSLPKIETLRVIIPGLFGYRMDTPDGGNYWGAVGQQPGNPKTRHSGSGVYGGVLVAVVAFWALFSSARRKNSPYSDAERRAIWFWGGVALVSLLLAYGRHAPLYQFFYKLPYFSTIRNPIKFMHPFHVAWVILFGYGLQGLFRQYVERNLLGSASLAEQFKAWWVKALAFERKWTIGSIAALGASTLGGLLYAASHTELRRHLEEAGFPTALAVTMARFSFIEVAWFILFLMLSLGAVVFLFSGALSGSRAKWAALVLGLLLVADFSRANSPWIVYYNYQERYSSNPIIDFLREKPHEHRAAARLMPRAGGYLAVDETFPELYQVLLEHHFQYYRIQALDIIQMPRMPELDDAYLKAFMPPKDATNLVLIGRLWQLTNTRYVLGMRPFLDWLNQQVDPVQKGFRVKSTLGPQGQFALFENQAALPRAKLFTHWQVMTNNDPAVLQRLTDPAFDPNQTVLLSEAIPAPPPLSTNQNSGTVTTTQYEPKRVALKSDASTPTVLLLNDRHDEDWKVWVDGEPKPLLRCNFIMRGVYLPAGRHAVEFRYEPSTSTLYVSLAAIAVGLALCGFLLFTKGPPPAEKSSAETEPAASVSQS